MKYQKKPVVIEAITFDELVVYGISNGGNVVNGLPWSFKYAGHPISHENDDCYLIPTPEGVMKMGRGDMLITGVKGEIYPCKLDIFQATYEPVQSVSNRRPQTFGEKAVSLSFNPSNQDDVAKAKAEAAALIDRAHNLRQASDSPMVWRMAERAITHAQEAQMWLVKAQTWKD